jgi:hypothetical protein
MPRESIRLNLSNPFTVEPGATFLSFLAYPNPADATARAEFSGALCRFAIIKMCDMDRGWARIPQSIKPGFWLGSDSKYHTALKVGCTKLKHRMMAAIFFAIPHLQGELRGCKLTRYEGYEPTVEHLAHIALERMGWKGDSASTVKSRIWGPSRPVIHAAAMLIIDARIKPENSKIPEMFSAYLRDPELLRDVLVGSEIVRILLPRIEHFRIKEETTIQFLP